MPDTTLYRRARAAVWALKVFLAYGRDNVRWPGMSKPRRPW